MFLELSMIQSDLMLGVRVPEGYLYRLSDLVYLQSR